MPGRPSKRRTLARYDFEGGGAVEISSVGNIDTAVAIKVAETLLSLKREELGKLRPQPLLKAG